MGWDDVVTCHHWRTQGGHGAMLPLLPNNKVLKPYFQPWAPAEFFVGGGKLFAMSVNLFDLILINTMR